MEPDQPATQTSPRPAPSAAASAAAAPRSNWKRRLLLSFVFLLGVGLLAWMWYWDHTPAPFNPVERAQQVAKNENLRPVVGFAAATAEIDLIEAMLDKRGGYLSNDIMPPGLLMDNVPNWEFGVLQQSRDFAKAMRNGFSRSQSQSVEDKNLAEADPKLSFSNDAWLLPATESYYREAKEHVEKYRSRLADADVYDGQFYARADNLAEWLGMVEARLGSLSQRLSASVGQTRIDTDLANTRGARQSTERPSPQLVQTPWREIDDVFYEARGTTWALAHLLKAVEHDFGPVLDDKNARVSVQQIIRELEEAQAPIRSPIILNGSRYGFFANHSLVMANYVSRANAAVIDLRQLLSQG